MPRFPIQANTRREGEGRAYAQLVRFEDEPRVSMQFPLPCLYTWSLSCASDSERALHLLPKDGKGGLGARASCSRRPGEETRQKQGQAEAAYLRFGITALAVRCWMKQG